jgi:hypothetical protein
MGDVFFLRLLGRIYPLTNEHDGSECLTGELILLGVFHCLDFSNQPNGRR